MPEAVSEWLKPSPQPMSAPQVADRPPTGLMGEEEAAQRQREGFEPPGEWTGGRISMADGGALEPVDGNPFEDMSATLSAHPVEPPDQTVQPSDIDRAKGFPEPRSDMHRRIAEASRDAEAPQIMGHVAAAPVPGQVMTPKYLEATRRERCRPGDPSLAESIQQGVSESAQRAACRSGR